MTKLIIEADLSSEELQVLISEVTMLHRDVFKKQLVLQQTDVSGALPQNESPIELIERRFVTADGVIEWNDQFKGLLTNMLGGNDR